ncbi:Hypothetical predicted protein [Paramuricea clavata]|uniref:Uncharacterized protein n=1 Tax=Paramuricea clavata TaxID=317549 RepID=A0A7D9DW25_PARCT|nr:Hypothetical predicted protein [Paramuricea clavata]
MFINDLPLYANSNTDMYADDSTIHTSARTVEELNNKLTEDMTNVQAWCTDNNMVINDGKTKAMMITTSQRAATLNSNLRVEFTGVQLKNTNNEKILGVVMNEHLSWKQQIDKVAKSLIKGIHLLRQIKEYLPIGHRVIYYKKQNTLVLHGDASLALANTLITVCGAPTTSNEFTAKPNAVEDGELSDNICMPTISSVIEQRHNNNTNAVTADSIVDMTTEIPNQSFKSDVHSEKLKVRSNSLPCNVVHDFEHGCQCRLLAADLEEVKLDMVIMQRNMESKIFAIEKSRESEEINQLQKELSNEREKCKNLEADISILIRGRNKEVNELNNTIVSLENRLKSSEAMNESLRQSIMQMKNHAIIDETSITSIVHSIDNPLGSSSFSGVFNSDDQPDDLPLCIKNFTTIDEASITPEAHCIDNTLGSQSDDFLSGFENFTVADGVNIAIDRTDSSLNTSSSFKKQLKKYREKQSLAFPNRSHNWMKPVPTNPQTTELNTFNTNKRNQHLSRNTVRSRKNFKSKQTKPKRNFRKKLSLDRPPDWENYLDLVSKITRT